MVISMIILNDAANPLILSAKTKQIDWQEKAQSIAQELDYMMRFYYGTLNSMSDILFIVDKDGIVRYASKEATDFFGLRPLQICGHCYLDLPFPNYTARGKKLDLSVIEVVLRTRIGLEDLYLTVRAGEKNYIFDRIVKPVCDAEEEIAGVLFYLKNRSTQAELYEKGKQLLHLSQMGEIAAGVVHEIRNPLQIVRSYLQLIQAKYGQDNFMQKSLPMLFAELDRSNAILTEYLQTSRIHACKEQICYINELCGQVLPLFFGPALLNGIAVEEQFSGDLPAILVDSNRFKQILVNFLNNAVAAVGPGGKIVVKTYAEGAKVYFSVEDNGRGMDEKTLASIGKPFFTTKEKGTGMGIYTSFALIKQMHGEVQVKSALGKGTVFTVCFPKKTDKQQQTAL